jgi:hypothetical protein
VNTKRAKRGYRDCGSDTAITAAARQALRVGIKKQEHQQWTAPQPQQPQQLQWTAPQPQQPQQEKSYIDSHLDQLIYAIAARSNIKDDSLWRAAMPNASGPQQVINSIEELERRCAQDPSLAAEVKQIIINAISAKADIVEKARRLSQYIQFTPQPPPVAFQQAASVSPPQKPLPKIPSVPAVTVKRPQISVAALVPVKPEQPTRPAAAVRARHEPPKHPLPIPPRQPVNPSAPHAPTTEGPLYPVLAKPEPEPEPQPVELKPTTGTVTLHRGEVEIQINSYPNRYDGFYADIYGAVNRKYDGRVSIVIDQACPVHVPPPPESAIMGVATYNAMFFGCEMVNDKKVNCDKVVVTRERLGDGYGDPDLQGVTDAWIHSLRDYISLQQMTLGSDCALTITAAWTCGGNVGDTHVYKPTGTFAALGVGSSIPADNTVYGYTSGYLEQVYDETKRFVPYMKREIANPEYASFEDAILYLKKYKSEFPANKPIEKYVLEKLDGLVGRITDTGYAPTTLTPVMLIAVTFVLASDKDNHQINLALNPFVQSYKKASRINPRDWYNRLMFEQAINNILKG